MFQYEKLTREEQLGRHQRVAARLAEAQKFIDQALLPDMDAIERYKIALPDLDKMNVDSCLLPLFAVFLDEIQRSTSELMYFVIASKIVSFVKNGELLKFLIKR